MCCLCDFLLLNALLAIISLIYENSAIANSKLTGFDLMILKITLHNRVNRHICPFKMLTSEVIAKTNGYLISFVPPLNLTYDTDLANELCECGITIRTSSGFRSLRHSDMCPVINFI